MADFEYVVPTGLVMPDTSDILEEINDEWRASFGDDLNVDPSTPQGVVIAGDTELRDGTVRNNAALANQINPDYAGGVFLDAIWRLTRGSRRGALPSTLSGVVLTGQNGTTVPAGSLARIGSDGEQFATVAAVVIGLVTSGQATVDMQSVTLGPVPAAVGALTDIVTSVLGWETVTNPNAAVPGRLVESDAASRRRRRNTLALQSVAMSEAIISTLYNIDSVKSLQYRENYEDFAQTIDTIPMKAKSIWVCVDGGTDAQIATGLLSSKSGGAGYNGAVSVSVVEPNSGQTCQVLFDRALKFNLFARVYARFNNIDGASVIPMAVMQYANGELEGDAGFVVGASVSPFEIAAAVNQVEPSIFVTKVEISTNGLAWSTADLEVPINQQAVITSSRVLVVSV